MSDDHEQRIRTLEDAKARGEERDVSRDRQLAEIHYAVVGNGTPGLKTTVDRLVQREEGRTFWSRTLGATTIGLLVERGWHYMTKGGV